MALKKPAIIGIIVVCVVLVVLGAVVWVVAVRRKNHYELRLRVEGVGGYLERTRGDVERGNVERGNVERGEVGVRGKVGK